MLAWQINLAIEAERAVNLCNYCDKRGHYSDECPIQKALEESRLRIATEREKRQQNLSKRRDRRLWIALGILCGVCILLGMWLESQWWWAL